MLRKTLAVLLSIVFLGISGSINSAHLSLEGMWGAIVFDGKFLGPLYLIGGIPLSVLIERILNRKIFVSQSQCYFVQFGWYSLAGIVMSLLFDITLITIGGDGGINGVVVDSMFYLFLGVLVSLIYYHMLLVVNLLSSRHVS